MQLMCVLGSSGKNCVHRIWGGGDCGLNHVHAKVEGAMRVCSDYVYWKELMCRCTGEYTKPKELKYYKLESRTIDPDRTRFEWRYYSLYNGARGAWRTREGFAIEEGEAHKALIISLRHTAV